LDDNSHIINCVFEVMYRQGSLKINDLTPFWRVGFFYSHTFLTQFHKKHTNNIGLSGLNWFDK